MAVSTNLGPIQNAASGSSWVGIRRTYLESYPGSVYDIGVIYGSFQN